MSNYSPRFASFRFVLRFESPLFWLVSIRLRIQPLCIRFGHESNHKNHYSPELSIRMDRSRQGIFRVSSCLVSMAVRYLWTNQVKFIDIYRPEMEPQSNCRRRWLMPKALTGWRWWLVHHTRQRGTIQTLKSCSSVVNNASTSLI